MQDATDVSPSGHKASTIVGAVAVLVVKIPKTEEYKALQPKKVEIT